MDWETGERIWRMVPKVGRDEFRAPSGDGADHYRPPPGQDGFGIGSFIYADGRFLALGENGLLAWFDLSPEGCIIRSFVRLFNADQTWTAPVLSGGRAVICQNRSDGPSSPKIFCLRLGAETE